MKFNPSEQGQTLVETMVAIFIMVMGVTAALGLAIYSFNAASLVNKQIIGMGLAREGIEAVKNMRDTNWLQSSVFDSDCQCYPNWRTAYYNIRSISPPRITTLDYNPFTSPHWILTTEASNFRLSYDPTSAAGRMYFPNTSGGTASDYYRRITINQNTNVPYDGNSARMEVTSDVWWKDKKCPEASTYETSSASCRVRLQTYLTNWKNY